MILHRPELSPRRLLASFAVLQLLRGEADADHWQITAFFGWGW